MLLGRQQLQQRRDFTAADQICLAKTNLTKLHQHLVLLADQFDKFLGGQHRFVRWVTSDLSGLRSWTYHLLMFASSIRHSSRFSTVVLAKSASAGSRSQAI